ncbi:MAG: DNA gyrase inhibitor YacG [Planctomycetota bacterium]|jgi:endogenous inhibitor of DNA gyrase (YacG/DUF329 family)
MGRGELEVSCPICGAAVTRSAKSRAPFFPFCSQRCKLVDLGKWFDEEYRIKHPAERGGEGETGGASENQ